MQSDLEISAHLSRRQSLLFIRTRSQQRAHGRRASPTAPASAARTTIACGGDEPATASTAASIIG